MTSENQFGPQINFDWDINASDQKFMLVDHGPDGLSVTVHPGLSHQQVTAAAMERGEHGPAVISAWERHTGFTSEAN